MLGTSYKIFATLLSQELKFWSENCFGTYHLILDQAVRPLIIYFLLGRCWKRLLNLVLISITFSSILDRLKTILIGNAMHKLKISKKKNDAYRK